MPEIIGVRFRNNGKIYYFDPKGYKYKKDVQVLVETSRGTEAGTVEIENAEKPFSEALKPVKRQLNKADYEQIEKNKKKQADAKELCEELVKKHNLELNLVETEVIFDGSKVVFSYTSEGRVDFRELVKELAQTLKMRIEMRQIGVRDEAKIINGYGICGLPFCCATWITDFAPISIKMAKDQNINLNPSKISGVCGRLKCCLKYEEEAYESLLKGFPHVGDTVSTKDGMGEVIDSNVLKQILKVAVRQAPEKKRSAKADEKIEDTIVTNYYHASEVKFVKRGRKQSAENVNMDELKNIID